MSWAAHATREETAAWIDQAIGEIAKDAAVPWAIEHEGKVIGS